MDQFSSTDPRNPKPGVIFEDHKGALIVLNPDLSVTIARGGETITGTPALAQWETWQVDAFDAMVGIAPEFKLGPVGLRMAENYEVATLARIGARSFYAA